MTEPAAGPPAFRRALLVVPEAPDANGAGLQRRCYQHLWCLSRLAGHVDLLVQPRRGPAALPTEVREGCGTCVVLPAVQRTHYEVRPRRTPGVTLAGEALRAAVPHWHAYDAPARAAIDARIRAELPGGYDAVVFCRAETAWLDQVIRGLCTPRARRLLDFDDWEAGFMRQQAEIRRQARGRELTAAYRARAFALERIARRLCGRFDAVALALPDDAERLRRGQPAGRQVSSLPNCMPLREPPLPPRARGAAEGATLLFVGLLGYVANSDGVLHFCREVLPLLRERAGMPVRLLVVGRDAPPEVAALHDPPRVEILGWVEDLEPCYAAADMVVVPLRMGSGTRIKALEAVSFNRPVVSTPIGVAGLGLEPGRSVLLAETPEAFAEACAGLLRSPERGAALAEAARVYVRAHLGYEAALSRLRELLQA